MVVVEDEDEVESLPPPLRFGSFLSYFSCFRTPQNQLQELMLVRADISCENLFPRKSSRPAKKTRRKWKAEGSEVRASPHIQASCAREAFERRADLGGSRLAFHINKAICRAHRHVGHPPCDLGQQPCLSMVRAIVGAAVGANN